MSLVILQPCGNKDAREHYEDTIKNPVDLETLKPYLTPDDYDELQQIYRNGMVRIWGVTPGKTGGNIKKWDRINPGDITLLSASGKIFACATTSFKIHNVALAKHLWDVDKNNQTWEYIYFVSEVKPLDIAYKELNAVIPYDENYVIQGFTVLDQDKSNNVLSAFDLYSDTFYPTFSPPNYFSLLLEEDTLDTKSLTFRRREQAALRSYLFNNRPFGTCCICLKSFPVDFLVAAHIKKRSKCSLSEKQDFRNIVAPMCKFGCDELYEKGYIGVLNSIVTPLNKEPYTDITNFYIQEIRGNHCSHWRESTKGYFMWHYIFHNN